MAGDVPILLHLTKTAGGSLKSALQDSPDIKPYFIYGRPDVEAFVASPPADFDLIYGHSVFGVHETLGLAPVYGCFLRHPVARTVSHFWHLFNVDKSAVGEKIRRSEGIDDFVKNHRHWEFSEFMCRIISGVGTAKIDGQELYDRAQANIDQYFVFVGFQEFMDESVHRLRALLKARISLDAQVNVGRYAPDSASEETLERIRAANVQDLRLFKYCLGKHL